MADKPNIWRNAGEDGQFRRQTSTFRDTVGPEDMEAGRFLLYVNYNCPWANRCIIARSLLGLEDVIALSVLNPKLGDDGWFYDGKMGSDEADPITGSKRIKDVYYSQDPDYNLRFTIPVLFDKKTKRIVNNESSEILRILNDWRVDGKVTGPDLYPEALRSEIDEINSWIYDKVNNGVYKSGFASKQDVYEGHARALFEAYDRLDRLLADRDYLVGPGRGQLTEADVRLFPTVARQDPAYHYFFRCNLYKITERYHHLNRWFMRLYKQDAFRKATNVDMFKAGYADSQKAPSTIVPIGPANVYFDT